MQNEKIAMLVFGYGLKNSGDMAITIGAINQLLNVGYKVKLISLFDKNHIEYKKSEEYLKKLFPEVEIYESPFKLNREQGKLGQIFSHIDGLTTILGIKRKQWFRKIIKESNVVIFNGGNLFRAGSMTDCVRLAALTYPIRLARKSNTPYQIFPQSAYKINLIGKLLLKKEVKEAEVLWAREEISYKYLQKKFNKANIKKSIDLAFFIDKEKINEALPLEKSSNKICFTIRAQVIGDLKKIDEDKYNKIVEMIENTIESLLKDKDKEVILVVQSIKDFEITKSLFAQFEKEYNNISLVEEYDPLKLAGLFKRCDLLVGMRLHSIIVALLAGTPAIGFFDEEWGFKNPGLMKEFNLPYALLNQDIESLRPLIETVYSNYEKYSEEIHNKIESEKKTFETMLEHQFRE